jgi:hypothetical protein
VPQITAALGVAKNPTARRAVADGFVIYTLAVRGGSHCYEHVAARDG